MYRKRFSRPASSKVHVRRCLRRNPHSRRRRPLLAQSGCTTGCTLLKVTTQLPAEDCVLFSVHGRERWPEFCVAPQRAAHVAIYARPLAADGIDLVDKHDARRILLRLEKPAMEHLKCGTENGPIWALLAIDESVAALLQKCGAHLVRLTELFSPRVLRSSENKAP